MRKSDGERRLIEIGPELPVRHQQGADAPA